MTGDHHTVLVLGGGLIRGLAHAGVALGLRERGIRVDAVVGTSIGAVVGAHLAAGITDTEILDLTSSVREKDIFRPDRRVLLPGGVRRIAVLDGGAFRSYLERTLPVASFRDLQIPLYVNTVSLRDGEERWFGGMGEERLRLSEAVYASAALPVFFPPLQIDGDLLVDGGVQNVMGLEFAVEHLRAKRLVLVDVRGDWRGYDPTSRRMGLVGIHDRALSASRNHVARLVQAQWDAILASTEAYMWIRPAVGDIVGTDFSRIQDAVIAGMTAALDAEWIEPGKVRPSAFLGRFGAWVSGG